MLPGSNVDDLPGLIGPLIREVPDFPEPGVLFRDLAPVFADAVAFRAVVDALELAEGSLRPGQRVLVVDDVLATGGTVAATCALVERAGAKVSGIAVLLEIAPLRVGIGWAAGRCTLCW